MINPLVTVIIPNYRHAKYLAQRLDTVLNQTYSNMEVVIIDDCSDDNGESREVIERYRGNKKISHIIYNDRNSGNTFKQWDKGIRLAQGDLIWIAESDDYCELNMLEILVQEFCKYEDCVISYTTLALVNEEGERLNKRKIRATQHYSGERFVQRYLALSNVIRNASCCVFRKAAACNVNPRYMSYNGAGDYLFWIEIAEQGSVSIVNKQLSYFRIHNNNVTSGKDVDGSNMMAEKDIMEYVFQNHKVPDWRKRLIWHFHIKRVVRMQYNSPETRQTVENLWQPKLHSTLAYRIPYRIYKLTKSLFNYNI